MKLRFAFFAILLSSFALAQAPPPSLPAAKDILAKAIERAKAEKKQDQEDKYGWLQVVTEEKLGKDGQVEEKKTTEYDSFLIQGKRFLQITKVNGQAPSGDDLKKAKEREKKFRENLARTKKTKDPNEEDDDDDVELDEALISRYNFATIGKEEVNGRPSYMLTFLPKQGVRLPEKKKMDKLLNRLEGKVWFDTETYSLTKLDMSLTEPTTLMGGLGSVKELQWSLDLVAVEPGLFVPRSMNIRLDGRKLFSSMRVKQHVEFSNYRKLSQLAELK